MAVVVVAGWRRTWRNTMLLNVGLGGFGGALLSQAGMQVVQEPRRIGHGRPSRNASTAFAHWRQRPWQRQRRAAEARCALCLKIPLSRTCEPLSSSTPSRVRYRLGPHALRRRRSPLMEYPHLDPGKPVAMVAFRTSPLQVGFKRSAHWAYCKLFSFEIRSVDGRMRIRSIASRSIHQAYHRVGASVLVLVLLRPKKHHSLFVSRI